MEVYTDRFYFLMIIEAVGSLDEENQKIICYSYFDKLSYKFIAPRVGCSTKTIERTIEKNLLDIGRALFGFEDEFWDQIMEMFHPYFKFQDYSSNFICSV